MSLALLFIYLVLNMFWMLMHPSSGACDLLLSYFMGCIDLVRCVLVLSCGLAGVVWYPLTWNQINTTHEITEQKSRKLLRMDVITTETCWALNKEIIKHSCFSLHTDTTPPQPNHNVTPTHIEPEQYNPWNNSTNKSQAPEDGYINIRHMLRIK